MEDGGWMGEIHLIPPAYRQATPSTKGEGESVS